MVKAQLDAGVDPNTTQLNGKTPLYYALNSVKAGNSNKKILQDIIDKGAKPTKYQMKMISNLFRNFHLKLFKQINLY